MYRKEIFSVVYTNFTSFIPLEYKLGLSYTLFHRCFSCLVSGFSKFRMELEKLPKIISKNAYPQKFIGKCIFKFLNGIFERNSKTVPKKEFKVVLPYLGNMSNIIKTNKTGQQNLELLPI